VVVDGVEAVAGSGGGEADAAFATVEEVSVEQDLFVAEAGGGGRRLGGRRGEEAGEKEGGEK
jgi:hypothetical protein